MKKVESDPIRRAKIGVYEFEVKVDSSKDYYYEWWKAQPEKTLKLKIDVEEIGVQLVFVGSEFGVEQRLCLGEFGRMVVG